MKLSVATPGFSRCQRVHRLRALQRQQRMVGHGHHLAAVADVRDQVLGVVDLAAGVDHQEQVVGAAGHHQVVAQAALGVGEEGVALLAHRQVDDVLRHQAFQRGGGIVAAQLQLAHVRDIEQRGLVAAVPVLGQDAGGGTAPAWRSRRRAPSWRPVRHAGRAGACGAAERCQQTCGAFEGRTRPQPGGGMPSLSALPERLAAAPVPHWLAPSVDGRPPCGLARLSPDEERRHCIAEDRGADQSFCLSVQSLAALRLRRLLGKLSPGRNPV